MRTSSVVIFFLIQPFIAMAAQLPVPGNADGRIRYVTYKKDDVTTIHVQRGTATRIVFAADEKILGDAAATGFAADCAKPEFEWCIRADGGSNQLLVKPRDGATHNNLELRTDRRDYSFAFRVLPDAVRQPRSLSPLSARSTPMYRVIFRYPDDALPFDPGARNRLGESRSADLSNQLARVRPKPSNWRYSMQALAGSNDIIPTMAFDDGRFTYLQFPANREIPTVFYISPSGEEGRINFHMDAADSSLLVLERLSRRLVLRLGRATVGIWNDAYDANGAAASDGTTVEGVARDLRKGGAR